MSGRVEHPRDGLVHQSCPVCYGDGKRDVWIGDTVRPGLCGYCAGRGYVLHEAPKPAEPFAAIINVVDQACERMKRKGMP